MKKKLVFLLLLLCIGATEHAFSQMTKFKALFLYNFTQNVEWPSSGTSNEFIVTVIGDKEMATELKKLAKVKKVGSKTMVINSIDHVKEMGTTHLVYLSTSKSNLISIISAEQKDKPVLLVTSDQGLCSKGASISFAIVDGKLRYEISESNIEKQALKVNNKLLSLGIPIN